MINILIPAMGNSVFFENYYFPKLMIEINGETVLEKVISNFNEIEDKHFIFVLSEKECNEFHTDNGVELLSGGNCSIIQLKNETAGGLCTALMAIEHINNEDPLIIANFDQIIDVDYPDVIRTFEEGGFDAGVISFSSIHPRWSYLRIADDEVVELAEKHPISKHAIAGFYYFKHGSDFVEGAKLAIYKENNLNGRYYISASMNELVLMGRRIGMYEIDRENYHSFYSPDKIKEYEKTL